MKRPNQERGTCQICGKVFPRHDLFPAASIREPVVDVIREQFPQWSAEGFICRPDLAVFRTRYIERMVASERGEMTTLENEVVKSLREHEVLASNTEQSFERGLTIGQRMGHLWWQLVVYHLVWHIYVHMDRRQQHCAAGPSIRSVPLQSA